VQESGKVVSPIFASIFAKRATVVRLANIEENIGLSQPTFCQKPIASSLDENIDTYKYEQDTTS